MKSTNRIEGILEEALKRTDNDRYRLSCIVFARIKELGDGAKPLVNMSLTEHKLTDIALTEIAEGKIEVERIDTIS